MVFGRPIPPPPAPLPVALTCTLRQEGCGFGPIRAYNAQVRYLDLGLPDLEALGQDALHGEPAGGGAPALLAAGHHVRVVVGAVHAVGVAAGGVEALDGGAVLGDHLHAGVHLQAADGTDPTSTVQAFLRMFNEEAFDRNLDIIIRGLSVTYGLPLD